MDTKKIYSLLALFIGQAILVSAFIIFAAHWETSILVLNILVASLVYGLCFAQIALPWVHLSDPSQKQLGALGLRWAAVSLYAIAAIGVMLLANLFFLWSFLLQLLVQGGLIALLLLSAVGALSAAGKVAEVDAQQAQQQEGLSLIRKEAQHLKNLSQEISNLPEPLVKRIATLEENMRFLSPANTPEAHAVERRFVQTATDLSRAIPNHQIDKDRVEELLKKLERLFQERKNLYSN